MYIYCILFHYREANWHAISDKKKLLIPFQRPTPLPICVECLGTDKCNPVGEEEPLISCYGCGNSVHPSCRVYSVDLVHKFQREGWTCDDCKCCLICGESQTNVRSFSCSETDILFAKLYMYREKSFSWDRNLSTLHHHFQFNKL